MTLPWLILLLLHQGYTLVPVTTVQLGEPVTLTCVVTETFEVMTWIHWYKQSAGNTLELIAVLRKSTNSTYGPGFSPSRFKITYNDNKSIMMILSTVEQDEGMYHCAHIGWTKSAWSGTYLSLRGNSQRTSSYNVVQERAVSDPPNPTEKETLQCSILSDSENTTCSGEPTVFWFRARSDTSYPDIIYTVGNTQEHCGKTNNQKKCSYTSSNDVSSSEADTYYCAVATCGEIIFGNGPKRVTSNEDNRPCSERIVLLITLIALAISVTMNIILICCRTQRSACARFKEHSSSVPPQPNHRDSSQPMDKSENELDLNYAALHFSGIKKQKEKKKRELKTEESVYSQVLHEHAK
ncbi:PREDICTED: uncharacterized protein LOC107100481 [Cyprinodon variegatus]|uniref:uncharacterized protein LOC107100481 n=1 Tax=Cyprinodon variegatus TaxID=28743 RepID=UPI000742A64F|nr:PREDICTED: uncharacterized protein LOC107100481 [Cyprinodon variegatus]